MTRKWMKNQEGYFDDIIGGHERKLYGTLVRTRGYVLMHFAILQRQGKS